MGYTHHDKISAENGFAVGADGSETEVIDSSGRVVTGADDYDYIHSIKLTLAGTATTYVVGVPGVAGTIEKIITVLDGAISTGDAALTFKIGTTAITGGVVTIANSGSAQGDVDTATPTAKNTITATNYVAVADDGASAGGDIVITLLIKKT